MDFELDKGGISVIMVPIDTPGIEIRPLITWDDFRTNETFFTNVRVPKINLIGEVNRGWQYITGALDLERGALTNAGDLRRAVDELIAAARTALSDGSRPIDNPDVRRKIAQLDADACPPKLVRQMKEPDSDGFPAQLWQGLAGMGAFGLTIDKESGGEGAGLYELGLLFGEAGRVLCPTVVYSTLIFGAAAQRLADPDQAKRLLPALARGDIKATTAMWNPADAGDTRPAFTAERAEGG